MEVPSQKHLKRNIFILVILTILMLSLGFFVYHFFMRPKELPWLFKGAYARYYGEMENFPIEYHILLRVVNFNQTHAKILMHIEVKTPFETGGGDFNVYFNIINKSYSFFKSFKEGEIAWGVESKKVKYEREINVEKLGKRKCEVYGFVTKAILAVHTFNIYVDKETYWPIRFEFFSIVGVTTQKIDINMVETNIPYLNR